MNHSCSIVIHNGEGRPWTNDNALLIKNFHNKRLIFLGTEIAKDLSFFYPDKINPDSKYPMNSGVKSALRLLKVPVSMLCKITGLPEIPVEHSLCEFSKYLSRKDYYRKTGKFKSASNTNRAQIDYLPFIARIIMAEI